MSYHAFTNLTVPITGAIVVPQAAYTRSSPPYPPFPTILFHHGQHPGISLSAILTGRQNCVPEGDSRPSTTSTSTKIKIRIIWPGYEEFAKDINAKEHTRAGEPIPKWKLAFCVAQVVQAFYSSPVPLENPPEGCNNWALRSIPFHSLRLLELRQVSTGSWQPVLAYEPSFGRQHQ